MPNLQSTDLKTTFHSCTHTWNEEPKFRVLVIYTGGTIGGVHADRSDQDSPLVIAKWDELSKNVPKLEEVRNMGVRIDAVSFDSPIDSANIIPEYWTKLSELIVEHNRNYTGFVIVHGTDTMVYTASALSFMLIGLGKPIVLTGAQVPIIGRVIEDGTRNLLGAIVCATQDIPEVAVFFDRFLYRGNRTSKDNASGLDGFWSPNYPPLAELRDTSMNPFNLAINHDVIQKKRIGFSPQIRVNANVIPIKLFPGINGRLLGSIFDIDDLDGVVLEAYGTGNAPSNKDFLDALKKAKCVLDASQCNKGEVHLGQYETGAGLLRCGVLSGSDITTEAALCKMLVLLSNENYSNSARRRDLERNLAGEQSQSMFRVKLESTGKKGIEGNRWDFLQTDQGSQAWDQTSVSRVVLNLLGGSLRRTDAPGSTDAVAFDAYINLDSRELGNPQHTGYAGSTRKQPNSNAGILTFDISNAKALIGPNSPLRISLVADSSIELEWEEVILMVIVREKHGST